MTKNEKYIVDMYVSYFGRAADAATIATYAEDKKTSVILKNIIADADAEKAGLSTSEFVDNAFQNLFGRDATTKEMNKYSKVIDAGKNLPINSIVKSAGKVDKTVNKNKLEVAAKYAELGGKGDLDLSKISKGNTVDLNKVVTLTDLTNEISKLADSSGIPSSFDGKTFFLTTSVDAGKDFIGTNKDDLFIADNSFTVKTSAADTLDGGKGTDDTFKLYASAANPVDDTALPTLKNIENVVIHDNTANADLAKWDSVETLSLVREAGANTYDLGKKVTTVNVEDTIAANAPTLKFNDAVAAATIGVNKVGVAGTAATVTVDSAPTAALKTLTINASGKASNVILDQNTTDTIETLNITGRADLTLAYATPAGGAGKSKIATIDGSKAQGKLDLDLANTTAATLKTVKTGTGDDKLTVNIAVANGTTINLGAGNDKLVQGTGGTIAAGSIIDGGAGIDSLDSALVTVGNEGVFASFEIISLTAANTASPLDLDLLTKSTITSIAKDGANNHALLNVKKSQALTVNTAGAANTTTLTFKASEIAGTADAYTINFNANNAGVLNAGTVSVEGIETVTVNSIGKTGATNLITLEDKAAKSLVITGDKELTLAFGANGFGTAFTGTDGKGVSTIDASASTAGITIADLTAASNLKVAAEGLTIKGGAGDDTIDASNDILKTNIATLTIDSGAGNDTLDLSDMTVVTTLTKADINVNAGAGNDTIKVGVPGGTFTLGAGKDTIDVSKAVTGATTVAGGAIKTTITDIEKGDVILGLSGNLFAQANINGANNLDAALGLAAAGAAGVTTWFQYAGKTYIVDDITAGAFAGTDIVVELNGTVNLGSSTFDATANTLTIA